MINLRSIKKGDVLLGTESDERFLVVSTGEKLSGDGFTTIQFTLLKNGSAVVASESISYDVYKRNPEATPLSESLTSRMQACNATLDSSRQQSG